MKKNNNEEKHILNIPEIIKIELGLNSVPNL